VRKFLVIGVVAILAILFVQPIRAYRTAQSELTSARTQLADARSAKERAIKERDALGTREMLVREARRRGRARGRRRVRRGAGLARAGPEAGKARLGCGRPVGSRETEQDGSSAGRGAAVHEVRGA
jgi:hypothetical protein